MADVQNPGELLYEKIDKFSLSRVQIKDSGLTWGVKKNVNVICLPTKHQGVHKNLFRNVRAFQDRIGIWKCWFFRRGENRSTRIKTSRSREENQQQTQPTYDAGYGNQTRDTLMGGKHSRHCAIPAPHHRFWLSKYHLGCTRRNNN